jgi:hypothetical protein
MATTADRSKPIDDSVPAGDQRRILGRRGTIAAVAALVTVTTASLAIARITFDRRLAAEVTDLFAAAQSADPTYLTESDLTNLPAPVERWLRYSGVVGQARPNTVRLKYDGVFRLSDDQAWMPYTSQTYYTTNPPALLWTAQFRMFRFVPIAGRDRYAGGEGSIAMKLLSLIHVADNSGGGLDQGALLRYLGETCWFPAGAVSPFIVWEPRDQNSAVATMTYGGVSASATFHFDEEGQITKIAAQRYNDAKGRLEPWTIPISRYGEFDGIRAPVEGEGVWNYATDDFTYIRWRVTGIEYNRPERY